METTLMVKALDILERVIAERDEPARVLAPVARRGRVAVRVKGLVRRYRVTPSSFEGWGVFRVVAPDRVALERRASRAQREQYLERLPSLRWVLVSPYRGQSWWAVPRCASVARQQLKQDVGVALVHLVEAEEGRGFEPVVARFDGACWWSEASDWDVDPRIPEALREALLEEREPAEVSVSGLTPGFREAYARAYAETVVGRRERVERRARERLSEALTLGGGELVEFESRDESYWLRWRGRDGEEQVSSVSSEDLTVLSAGICLSGEDEKFDLQSLVGVIDDAW